MKLYLLRHGECRKRSAEESDPPLTDEGVSQSEKLSRMLKSADISVVYYSPHLRAKQTADIIVSRFGGYGKVLMNENPLIREKQDPEWFNIESRRNLPWDIIKQERLDPDWKMEEGESFNEIKCRINSALDLMIKCHGTNTNVLWVTHNSIIKFIVSSVVLGRKGEELDLFYSIFDRIEIKRGNYYVIEYKKKHYENNHDWYLTQGGI